MYQYLLQCLLNATSAFFACAAIAHGGVMDAPAYGPVENTSAEIVSPTIDFAGSAIVVSSVPPGDRVVLYGLSRQPVQYGNVLVRRALIQVASGSGTAR